MNPRLRISVFVLFLVLDSHMQVKARLKKGQSKNAAFLPALTGDETQSLGDHVSRLLLAHGCRNRRLKPVQNMQRDYNCNPFAKGLQLYPPAWIVVKQTDFIPHDRTWVHIWASVRWA